MSEGFFRFEQAKALMLEQRSRGFFCFLAKDLLRTNFFRSSAHARKGESLSPDGVRVV
jgi:hypothetical protein